MTSNWEKDVNTTLSLMGSLINNNDNYKDITKKMVREMGMVDSENIEELCSAIDNDTL